MLKFKSYLTEGAPTTAQQATWFRAYVKEKVLELNLKITQSSRPRGYAHIKFPTIMPAGKTLFAGWGIKVNDYKGHQKISSRYTPFILVANENIEVGTEDKPKTIPKGTELNWVNSEISQAKLLAALFETLPITLVGMFAGLMTAFCLAIGTRLFPELIKTLRPL